MTVNRLMTDSVIAADCSGFYVYTSLFAAVKILTTVSGLIFPVDHKC